MTRDIGSGSNRESPLIVGVLGHRELDADRMPGLCGALAGLLAEIEQHLPDTELRVIVGVTADTDLMFARAAIERGLQVETVSNASYTALTQTLVSRSSILLTPWDGHSPVRGGIAGAALRHVGMRSDSHGEVSLVMLGLAEDVDATDSLVYWTPVAAPTAWRMPPQLIRQLIDLNTYNRDFRRLRRRQSAATVGSLLARIPTELALDDRPALEAVDAEYGKADALALHYQSRSDRLFALFLVMAFTMGLAYLAYDKLTHRSALLVSYLVVLICSLSLYYALRGQRWFAKHLTYRALAETLRVTFYLRLAGIDHRLDAMRVLALSGINRFRGFSVITHVLAAVTEAQAREGDVPNLERSRCVEHEWIEGQYRYFTAKVAQLRRKGRGVKILKNALFASIVVGIIAMILSRGLMEGYKLASGVTLGNAVTFGEGVLALLLGAWQLHDTNKASRELLLQYRNQGTHFARARQQLTSLTDLAERNHILLELGRDSLMESYVWTIHRYHREHEPGRH